jgi:cell division protein FtsB
MATKKELEKRIAALEAKLDTAHEPTVAIGTQVQLDGTVEYVTKRGRYRVRTGLAHVWLGRKDLNLVVP